MTCLYHLLCDGSHLDNATNMCHFGLSWIWTCLGRRIYYCIFYWRTHKLYNHNKVWINGLYKYNNIFSTGEPTNYTTIIKSESTVYINTIIYSSTQTCPYSWQTKMTHDKQFCSLFTYIVTFCHFFHRDIYVINTFVCTYWLKSTRHCRVNMQFELFFSIYFYKWHVCITCCVMGRSTVYINTIIYFLLANPQTIQP
jgi:hypothetical protein